jgi:hypothetical protein
MRILAYSFCATLLISGLSSCKKIEDDQTPAIIKSCTSPPAPVVLVLLDKQGRNVVTAATDQVVISYTSNGQRQTIPCTLGSLVDASTRQPTTAYSGLAVGCDLGSYSIRQADAVKTFQVVVNAKTAGTLYYDLQPNPNRTATGVQDCFQLVSFRWNALPVQLDNTVMPAVAVLPSDL